MDEDEVELGMIKICFFAEFYTMIPTAALFGVGRGIFWVISSVFIVGYSELFTKFGHKYRRVVALTTGSFMASYFCGQVISAVEAFSRLKTTDV